MPLQESQPRYPAVIRPAHRTGCRQELQCLLLLAVVSTSALAYTLLSVSLDVLASPSVCTSVKISTNALPSASVCPNVCHCERVGQSVVPWSLDHLGSRQVPWSPHRQVCRQESSPLLCYRVHQGCNLCLGRTLSFSVFVFFFLLGLRQSIRLASVYTLHIVSEVFC